MQPAEVPAPQLGLRGRQGRRLTHDLLQAIFSTLSAKDLAAAELTCRHCAGCDLRREFLHAASARRWVGSNYGACLASQDISTAPALHMAACGGVLACAMGEEVRLYHVNKGAWRHRLSADAAVGSVAMATPYLTLAAAGRRVLLWRNAELVRSFTGASAALHYVGTANGVVASATLRDSAVQLHDLYGGGLTSILRPHGSGARLTALHLTGIASGAVTLASGAAGTSIRVTDVASGSNIHTIRWNGVSDDLTFDGAAREFRHSPSMIQHIPEQQRLLAGWYNGGLAAFDLRKAGEVLFTERKSVGGTWAMCVPPMAGGTICVMTNCELGFEVVDTATGRVLASPSPPQDDLGDGDSCHPPQLLQEAATGYFEQFGSRRGAGSLLMRGSSTHCVTTVEGHLAVSTHRGVKLWRLPGYETLTVDPAQDMTGQAYSCQ